MKTLTAEKQASLMLLEAMAIVGRNPKAKQIAIEKVEFLLENADVMDGASMLHWTSVHEHIKNCEYENSK